MTAESKVQHHIHPRSRKTGSRYLPNACKNDRCKDRCKHDYPKEVRMHTGPPLLVCKGIAEQKGLPIGGTRSAVGGILGVRNNPWLNGTAPGLCIGLSGGNTDVQLNDLVPILPCTHTKMLTAAAAVYVSTSRSEQGRQRKWFVAYKPYSRSGMAILVATSVSAKRLVPWKQRSASTRCSHCETV